MRLRKLSALLMAGVLGGTAIIAGGTAVSAEEAGFGEKDPESYEADLKFMVHTTDQPNFMIERFNEIYPNIHVELIVVPAAEQQEKIMNMVAAGDDVPDLFTSRTQFVKAIVNSDQYYADLNSEPYNATDWTSSIEPYVVEVGTDTTGALRALSWQCPVGGIYYRRSLAKEIFGTDDPDEMSSKFASFDSLLETAREIKEKTNGEVKFDVDAITGVCYLGLTHAGGFLNGNTLNTGDEIREMFEVVKTMYEEDLTGKFYGDGQSGVAAKGEDKIFADEKPTWGLTNDILINLPEQTGDWGLAAAPYPYTAGGTWIGISKTTEHPEEAYLFMKFILTNTDFVYDYAVNFGDYVSNVNIQQQIGSMSEEEGKDLNIFSFLGGQNAYAYWNEELAKGVDAASFSPYDESFGGYLMAAMEGYALGNLSLDEAIEQYQAECQNYAPSIEIE